MKRTRQGQPPCETPESKPHFHSPQMEAMGLLLLVTRLHHSEIERRIASLGIHHSQNRMLLRLSCGDGTNSQRELADAMNISPAAVTAPLKPTVSVSLKALEREGYITRAMGDEDNRRNTVRITEEGLRKVEESHRIFEAMDKAAFAGFSDAELAALTETLRRMADNLRAATEKNAAGAEKSEQGKEESP